MSPIVRVVGLGPGAPDLITPRTLELITHAAVVRLRTRVHPAANTFPSVISYDDWYERAASFEELYAAIARDLAQLAASSPSGEVVYVVPGSPVVAERTVELVRAFHDIQTICEPAVSVIDVACGALGRDPMAAGLRIVDALATSEPLRGPGPLLLLQTYSPEVLVTVADRLDSSTIVTVLHHLGMDDQFVAQLPASELVSFHQADHLTSLWIEGLRTAGTTVDDLVDCMRQLRRECPWDQEQTHASLIRHLLEEAYEALDALETFAQLQAIDGDVDEASRHVEEELGDLLFQIVFHAEMADEEGLFNLATLADALRDKLVGRHPHVFSATKVTDAHDVATRWEDLKRVEKGRTSVTDGIAWQLPALSLYSKLFHQSTLVNLEKVDASNARRRAMFAISELDAVAAGTDGSTSIDARPWGDVVTALVSAAYYSGVDLEGVLRERARTLRTEIRRAEGHVGH